MRPSWFVVSSAFLRNEREYSFDADGLKRVYFTDAENVRA